MARGSKTQEFEKLRDAAAKARLPYDKDMLLNLAFFLDHQYVEWKAEGAYIREIPRPQRMDNAPRPVVNKISHFVVQEHAYAVANKPTPDVLPATDDPQDLSICAPALAYLRWLSDPQVGDYDGELSSALWWALVAGEGYMKWPFNAREKRPDFMAVSPLDIFADPYATRFKNARYVIHSQFMDVGQVHDTYGVKVKPQSLSKADQSKAALMRELGHAPILEGAVVNELWIKPGVTRDHKNGLLVTWAGDEILVDPTDFPYDHGHIPITQMGCIPRIGSPHYTCAVKYARSPQMELNKYHAQRLTVREKFANPKWWLPTDLELEADPDDSPAQILRGNSAGGTIRPELIQPTTFPENQDGIWLVSEMQDVMGLHEVSQGGVPGRVESAKAIESLRQPDLDRLVELEKTVLASTSEGFWQSLMLAKQYTPAEQIVQTYSREGLPEVKKFKAEKLSPGIRIQVTMGSGLSRSREARQNQAIMMWREGMVRDPEILSEILDIPVGTIAPQRAYDIRLARNENLLMASDEDEEGSGTAVKPNSWDAHDIHLREHNNFRKTSEYDSLDSEAKRKFEFHCQTHEELELQQLQKQAVKAMVAQGAGPPLPEGEQTEDPAASPDGQLENEQAQLEPSVA